MAKFWLRLTRNSLVTLYRPSHSVRYLPTYFHQLFDQVADDFVCSFPVLSFRKSIHFSLPWALMFEIVHVSSQLFQRCWLILLLTTWAAISNHAEKIGAKHSFKMQLSSMKLFVSATVVGRQCRPSRINSLRAKEVLNIVKE